MLCASLAVGYHVATSHHQMGAYRAMNEFNPGIYAQCDSLVGGAYLNSVGKLSVYAGKDVHISGGLSVIVGAVTGYARPAPMLTVSYRLSDGTRLSWIPTTPQNLGGLHFSKEF